MLGFGSGFGTHETLLKLIESVVLTPLAADCNAASTHQHVEVSLVNALRR